MAINKKQHFVPQHYLRQFSIEGTRQVSMCTISPPRHISTAKINRQCQENYFYNNEEGVDAFLTDFEKLMARLLYEITEEKRCDAKELQALAYFCVIMKMRTRKAIQEVTLPQQKMFHAVTEDAIKRGELPPAPKGWSLDSIEVGNACATMLQSSSLLCFLEMQTLAHKFIEASENSFFITSDNPVVTMNQALIDPGGIRSFAGFSRSGFQLILPLSSSLAVLFYDPKVYKVGTRRQKIVHVSEKDTEVINSLQIQSAENSVYFHNPNQGDRVLKLIAKYSILRQPMDESCPTYKTDAPEEIVFHTKQIQYQLLEQWKFCRLKRHPKYGIQHRRDPLWSQCLSEAVDYHDQHPEINIFKCIEIIAENSPLNY